MKTGRTTPTPSQTAALIIVILFATLTLTGCHSHRALIFADRDWHISDYYGQIIDRDTTWRMTFGDILIQTDQPVISCADSLRKYPGMDRFLADILHTAGLDSAEILFYAPAMATMFLRPRQPLSHSRPASISCNLEDDHPYTMWVNDDNEDWVRPATEMYTYTYFNRRKRQLLVVDHYDYGDEPVAQIFIFQSATKRTDAMKLPSFVMNHPFFIIHDIRQLDKDIEFWAATINGHRRLAFANYKIGQEQKQKQLKLPRQ